MLYDQLCTQARSLSSRSLAVPYSPSEWEASLLARREQWLEALGLSPLPERTEMHATITGRLERGDYVVEKLHYQSVPGAYVAGNIYRPAVMTEPLPAVLYLCGHTRGKVNPPYQANPRWFGQHGYIALVLDPIQLGECQGIHHGTYSAGRWDWYSRGYTPAGTEVWNAMRALDYLQSRPDVDPNRLGVTGLSGGGVISWCLGAADERVKCIVPVCQTGTIEHIVVDRATDGHCDCAFWINYHRFCTPDIGALIAPRPLLVAAGTEDVLWRPYGFRDAVHRIHHQYVALGAAENVKLVEDLTPHGYTPKLRQAIFSWFEMHLKGVKTAVEDDVTDFVEPEENLLVFGGNLPADDRMQQIDRLLVRRPPQPPGPEAWVAERVHKIEALRQTTFKHIPARPAPGPVEYRADGTSKSADGKGTIFGTHVFDTEDGLRLRVRTAAAAGGEPTAPTVLYALQPDAKSGFGGGGASRPAVAYGITTAGVEVRNTAATSVGPGYLWTLRRALPLLGHTLPERQVFDLLQAAQILRALRTTGPLSVFGRGNTAALAIYAAILDESLAEVILQDPPETHESSDAPELLGVLRIGDIAQNLALVFPRPVTFVGTLPPAFEWTKRAYEAVGEGAKFRVVEDVAHWRPSAP